MLDKYNTLHYMIAELKEYGIKHIVSSPGTQNSTFNYIVQDDPFFKCYSVVDERSAAYVALGIASEVQEPVVITCTGATAARNYMSAMTEAYYSEVPVIALTFYDPHTHKYNMAPQYTDRSVSQNDIKSMAVHLPEIKDSLDKKYVLTAINAAISRAKYNNEPVHIDCPSAYNYEIKNLPSDVWKTEYIFEDYESLKGLLKNKKVAVLIGRHRKFNKNEEKSISDFVKSYNAPVFCEHTSNYNGENKILIPQFKLLNTPSLKPDIVLDLGGISCIYGNGGLLENAEYWRVIENYKYSSREDRKMKKMLVGRYKGIFNALLNDKQEDENYYKMLRDKVDSMVINQLPLSTSFVTQKMAEYLPNDCSLHLAILMAVQNMNYFEIPSNVNVVANVGGFGIDGAISTAVGQSLVNQHKKCFCVTGDLAFFYDMNIVGNRHIRDNFRILLINNNKGFTMRANPHLEKNWGEKSDNLVTAAGHYKNGAKDWAISCGFEYLSANTKEKYESQIKDFCNKTYNKPVLFEVFTNTEEEKEGLCVLHSIDFNKTPAKELSLSEKIFSIRNEYSGAQKHKSINLMGAKIKIKVKDKNGKNQ